MGHSRNVPRSSFIAMCAVLLFLWGCQPEDTIAPKADNGGTIRHQSDLDELDGVVTIWHSLNLERDRSDPTDPIVSLDPLRKLQAVGGNFRIDDLDEVTTLAPLSSLRSVGLNLFIGHNDGITTLAPLSELREFGNAILIQYNSRLKSLEGLEGAVDLGRTSFQVARNDSLESLHGLESLRDHGAEYLTARFVIGRNPRLESLRGLENLRSVGTLSVTGNPLLVGLDDLMSLRVAGSLEFSSNAALCDTVIQDWAETIEVRGRVFISENAECFGR